MSNTMADKLRGRAVLKTQLDIEAAEILDEVVAALRGLVRIVELSVERIEYDTPELIRRAQAAIDRATK